jgi:ribosomal protein S18 acetylase RimI-like enzyme
VGPQPVGFALAGEAPFIPWVDTEHGRTATVWIAWVEPRMRQKGIALGMLAFGEPRLLELGFEIAAMSVREENPEGQKLSEAFGAKPLERFYHYTLGNSHGRR